METEEKGYGNRSALILLTKIVVAVVINVAVSVVVINEWLACCVINFTIKISIIASSSHH